MFFLCRQFFDKKEKQTWLEKTWRSCNLETKPWFNKLFVYYSNYSNSNIRIVLFGIRYSIIFKNRIYSVFGIRSFLKNRIYSVFGIRSILTIRENTATYVWKINLLVLLLDRSVWWSLIRWCLSWHVSRSRLSARLSCVTMSHNMSRKRHRTQSHFTKIFFRLILAKCFWVHFPALLLIALNIVSPKKRFLQKSSSKYWS